MRSLALAVLLSTAVMAPRLAPGAAAPEVAATTFAPAPDRPPAADFVSAPNLASAGVRHQPPVDGPVTDGFRPPSSPFGPGNRGIDYATTPGAAVRASADGVVVFAGQVGGQLHVVVLHADGIRTSYSFLAAISVTAGDRVTTGQEVGKAGRSVHFGARRGGAYIDPLTLFGREARVHLVADESPGPAVSAAPPVAPLDSAALRWARRATAP